MNELQIFEERNVLGKDFKIYGTAENPLFLAKDVAEWIDYDLTSTNKLVAMVDETEKLNGTIFLSGQNREVTFLTEDGLYEVLMQSRKPIAKEFKKQVKEILKSIRKHGGYITPQKVEEIINDPDTMIIMLNALKKERQEKAALLSVNKTLVEKIEADKPRVEYFEALVDRNLLTNIRDTAKELKIKQNEFVDWLLGKRFVYRDSFGKIKPYAEHTPKLFELKEWINGEKAGNQTMVTPRGRETFRVMLTAKEAG